MQREGGCSLSRQRHLLAVVGAFLIGCAVVLMAGASGVRAQEDTGATNNEQGRSPEASASEEARCERTRTIRRLGSYYLTNDLPGCTNKGGLLSAQLPDTGRRKLSNSLRVRTMA